MYMLVVNPEAPTQAVVPRLLIEDLDTANPVYDACQTDRDGTPAAIAWHEQGTTNIRIGYVDVSGVLGSPVTGHPSVHTFAAALTAGAPIAVATRTNS
jgi:hypothetical protein